MRHGLIGAGNFIIDYVYTVDRYPAEQTLANIRGAHSGGGGGAFNVLVDLAMLGADFPLEAAGLLGNDERGARIIEELQNLGVDVEALHTVEDSPTSFTLVFTPENSGSRTFFHERGANALFGPEHIDLYDTRGSHLHLAYLLLLDRMDEHDPEFGSAAARVLASAKELGLTTSIDLVSDSPERFESVVGPALRYVDVMFMNEFEATALTGVELTAQCSPEDVCKARAQLLERHGATGELVLHWAGGAVSCSATGGMEWQGAADMPREHIASVVGCGDAFAAGYLLSFLRNETTVKSLKLGVCSAAACATGYTCTNGLLPEAACVALAESYGFRPCP